MTVKTKAPAEAEVTLDQLKASLMLQYNEENLSRSTKVRASLVIDTLKDIGIRFVRELASGDIHERFEAGIERYAEATQRLLRITLTAIRNHAFRMGLLALPPGKKIPAHRTLFMPLSDVERLLDYLRDKAQFTWEDHRLYVLVSVVVFAELRLIESLDLCIEDIDRGNATIHTQRSKRNEVAYPRIVRFPSVVTTIIEKWLPRVAGDKWLFPGVRHLGPWTPDNARIELEIAGVAAGIPRVSFDALRRSYRQVKAWCNIPDKEFEAIGRIRAQIQAGGTVADALLGQGRADSDGTRRELTLEEATRLMTWLGEHSATLEDHLLYTYVGLALFAGLGRSDLGRLERGHVDFDRLTIDFPGRDPIPLSPEAAEILGEWLARDDIDESPFVFPGKTSKKHPTKYSRDNHFHKATADAGIPWKVMVGDLRQFWTRQENRVRLAAEYRSMKQPAAGGTGNSVRRRKRKPRKGRPIPAAWHPDAPAAIQIRRSDRVAIVWGQPKPALSHTETDVISALLKAGPGGLTLGELKAKLGTGSGRTTLTRLKQRDADWDAAILKPGTPYGRYRIAPNVVSDAM